MTERDEDRNEVPDWVTEPPPFTPGIVIALMVVWAFFFVLFASIA